MHAAPGEPAQEIAVRVTAFAISQCRGGTDESGVLSGLRTLDQEPVATVTSFRAESIAQWAPVSEVTVLSRTPNVPDKVPISIS